MILEYEVPESAVAVVKRVNRMIGRANRAKGRNRKDLIIDILAQATSLLARELLKPRIKRSYHS